MAQEKEGSPTKGSNGGVPGVPLFDVPDAEEVARVAARWAEARRREAIRQERAERWKKRLWKARQAVAVPWNRLQYRLEFIGRRIKEPWNDILLKIEAVREARAQKRIAYMKAMAPAREEAARKRWEKRRKRAVALEDRLAVLKERTKVIRGLFTGFFRRFESFQEDTKNFFLAPFHEIAERRAEAAEARRKKVLELLDKSRLDRDGKVRAKHLKMMEKIIRKRERAQRRRERLDGFYRFARSFGRIWRETAQIRRLIYLVAAAYLLFRYRSAIADKVGGFIGFDLQKLMK